MEPCVQGWIPEFSWYRDVYGGTLAVSDFAEALPAAVRVFRCVVGPVRMSCVRGLDLEACRRAVCAAAECLAEWGQGQVGGFDLGSFSVKHYDNRGTTGTEQAVEAVVGELAGTGLSFTGAGR